MKRKRPQFNEAYHGYRTFSELLEDAQKEGLLDLETDPRSRTYKVTRFGSEMSGRTSTERPARTSSSGTVAASAKAKSRRRRRGGRKSASAEPGVIPMNEQIGAPEADEAMGQDDASEPEAEQVNSNGNDEIPF